MNIRGCASSSVSIGDLVTQLCKMTSEKNQPTLPPPPKQGDYKQREKYYVEERKYRENLSQLAISPISLKAFENRFLPFLTDKSIKITVDDFHEQVSYIKFIGIRDQVIHGFGKAEFVICLKYKNETKTRAFLVRQDHDNCISHLIDQIQKNIPEHDIEKLLRKRIRYEFKPKPPSFWSREGAWNILAINEMTYIKTIDPLTIDTFKTYALAERQHYTIMDVGGGKGRVAKQLLEICREAGKSVTYLLLEPDTEQCTIAEETLKIFRSEKFDDPVECNVLVVNKTLQNFFNSSASLDWQNHVDVIISSGGPLNAEVVSFEEAKNNLSLLHKFLASDGILIATGMSPILVKKKEMQAAGFSVLSCVKRDKDEEDNVVLQQRYVMKS